MKRLPQEQILRIVEESGASEDEQFDMIQKLSVPELEIIREPIESRHYYYELSFEDVIYNLEKKTQYILEELSQGDRAQIFMGAIVMDADNEKFCIRYYLDFLEFDHFQFLFEETISTDKEKDEKTFIEDRIQECFQSKIFPIDKCFNAFLMAILPDEYREAEEYYNSDNEYEE